MELMRVLPLCALVACVVQSKRLVVPEDMRKERYAAAPAALAQAAGPRGSEIDPSLAVPGEKAPSKAFANNPYSFVAGEDAQPEARKAPAPKPASGAATPAASVKKAPAPFKSGPPAPSATPPEKKYVLRLAEHGRVWELELPEGTGGYEIHVPLGAPVEAPTAADQELLGKEPPSSKSYLATLARISEMYAAHRYEMALIEVVDFEQQFPKDARIAAMKGSLFQKLGKTQLAREAWKKALEIDPSDPVVAEALRGLKEE
jgi:hypothetical protein